MMGPAGRSGEHEGQVRARPFAATEGSRMSLDLARWQFAFTSINHFLFIPITIGLAFLTALLQTAWHRSGRGEDLRLTRVFGTLLVINVAIGVVTGLGQGFELGG